MLGVPSSARALTLAEVDPKFAWHLETRKGDWRVTVYEKSTDLGSWFMWGTEVKKLSVNFTENEFATLAQRMRAGISQGMKQEAMMAGLVNSATKLWPTGSYDHVVMSQHAIWVLLRYYKYDVVGCRYIDIPLLWDPIPKAIVSTVTSSLVAWLLKQAVAMHPSGLLLIAVPIALYYLYKKYEMRPTLQRLRRDRPVGDDGEGKTTDSMVGNPPAPPDADDQDRGSVVQDFGGGVLAPGEDFPPSPPPGLVGPAPATAPGEGGGPPPAPVHPFALLDVSEAENLMQSDCHVRVTDNNLCAIVGQNFNAEDGDWQSAPIMGALVGPTQRPPVVYSNTADNVQAAITERIDKKKRPTAFTAADKQKIGKFVSASLGKGKGSQHRGVFSAGRIHKWIMDHDFASCKSEKWSSDRFKRAVEMLYARDEVRYFPKVMVKAEPMPPGKAPRMLIADGDDGQIMALLVIKIIEDLQFTWFEERLIKHLSKRDAVYRAMKNVSMEGGKFVEKDGSAWDTTSGHDIRKLLENPIIEHVTRELMKFGVVPDTWLEAHLEVCSSKKLKMMFRSKVETIKFIIDAIRRSGHRGTGALNWLENHGLNLCVMFKEPERFLDPNCRKGEDVTGQMRWWRGCFEGDDTILCLKPPMEPKSNLAKEVEAAWTRYGFNMKIVYVDKRATFVGWHMAIENGVGKFACPEIPRAFVSAGVSVSTAARMNIKADYVDGLKAVGHAAMMARAYEFAGLIPSISKKFRNYALKLKGNAVADEEMSLRACGQRGKDSMTLKGEIDALNLEVSAETERRNLEYVLCAATDAEVAAFEDYEWDMDPVLLQDYSTFRESLPPSWRVQD